MRIVRADLLAGSAVDTETDDNAILDELREWLMERISVIRTHADRRGPRAGWECARCPYIAGCAALR